MKQADAACRVELHPPAQLIAVDVDRVPFQKQDFLDDGQQSVDFAIPNLRVPINRRSTILAGAFFADGGTSLAGFSVKKPFGLSRKPMYAVGITG